MKTKFLLFYSYKGGVGKSLAVANFANLLSRMGHCCAVLDTDFNAPSLHDKLSGEGGASFLGLPLGVQERAALQRADDYTEHVGGLVGYLGEAMRNCYDSANPKFEPRVPLATFFRQISTPATNKPRDDESALEEAMIHFLPAGNIYDPRYHEIVASTAMHSLFRISHTETDQEAAAWAEERDNFIMEIARQIKGLVPQPQFVLIDSPAGAISQAECLLKLLADQVVLLFANNGSSKNNLKDTYQRLASYLPTRVDLTPYERRNFVVPVVSRIPNESIGGTLTDHCRDVAKEINQAPEAIFRLRSDSNVEIREKLCIPRVGHGLNRILTKDYVELFAYLIKSRSSSDGDSQMSVSDIARHIGCAGKPDEERAYIYRVAEGELRNTDDETRNVAFKLTTFQTLLDGLLGGQRDAAQKVSGGTASEGVMRLRNAGRTCGASFGKALCESWQGLRRLEPSNAEAYRGVQADIQAWCDFDSRSGFGYFQLNSSSNWRYSGNFAYSDFVITLRNNFLVTNDSGDDAYRFCEWMSGYIEGVLSSLFPPTDTFSVSHEQGDRSTATSHFRVKTTTDDIAQRGSAS